MKRRVTTADRPHEDAAEGRAGHDLADDRPTDSPRAEQPKSAPKSPAQQRMVSKQAMAWREGAVMKVALLSRVVMFLLATVLGSALDDFDSSAFTGEPSPSSGHQRPPTKLDESIEASAGHLVRWDAVYFVHIALHGYPFEHFHAFFPGLPLLISFVNNTFFKVLWVKGFASEYNSAVLAGVIITNVFFILSAVELYRLSMLVVKKEGFATKSVLFYCLTPANIFMTSIYTESMFAFFFLRGLRLLFSGKRWEAALNLAGTCLARSNGAVCCLFLIYDALQRSPPPFLQYISQTLFRSKRSFISKKTSWMDFLTTWITTALQCLVVVTPLIAYLSWSYMWYCVDNESKPEWCDAMIPNIYSYVQAKYWNVGFLNYYEFKQIPNFLLASPVIFLSSWGIIAYLRRFTFFASAPAKTKGASVQRGDETIASPYFDKDVLPFIVYWMVLLVVGVLFMHVQVLTRFLSSCAPLYWFCAGFYDSDAFRQGPGRMGQKQANSGVRGLMQYLILFYFISYSLVGALLFCNFYPWT